MCHQILTTSLVNITRRQHQNGTVDICNRLRRLLGRPNCIGKMRFNLCFCYMRTDRHIVMVWRCLIDDNNFLKVIQVYWVNEQSIVIGTSKLLKWHPAVQLCATCSVLWHPLDCSWCSEIGLCPQYSHKDYSGYGFSQSEPTLHFNVVSHWRSPYPEWFLCRYKSLM